MQIKPKKMPSAGEAKPAPKHHHETSDQALQDFPAEARHAISPTSTSTPAPAPRRGRRPSPNSMTNAQRSAKYRASHARIHTGDRIAQTIRGLANEFGLDEVYVTRELLRFALRNRNWRLTGFPIQHDSLLEPVTSTESDKSASTRAPAAATAHV